jgi:hypothetical protein
MSDMLEKDGDGGSPLKDEVLRSLKKRPQSAGRGNGGLSKQQSSAPQAEAADTES